MLWRDFGMLPARVAAHDYCRSRTIKTPPFAVREQVALLARVDGVSGVFCDFPGLREIFAPVVSINSTISLERCRVPH